MRLLWATHTKPGRAIFNDEQLRRHLFPYNGSFLANVLYDVKSLLKWQIPPLGKRGGLPGLVQGLGLVALSGMAATGFVMFISIPDYGVSAPPDFYRWPKDIHDVVSVFVWSYWGGHVAMAMLHARQSPSVLNIFNVTKGRQNNRMQGVATDDDQ